MEAYGIHPGTVEGTVYTFNNFKENGDSGSVAVPDASEAFHTYGVELTPTEIIWTLDSKPYKSFKKPAGNDPDAWPFTPDNELYVILNLAMGSTGGAVDPSQNKWQMAVKEIAFYEYTGK
jgi:beta-glucanase (GH16 family)